MFSKILSTGSYLPQHIRTNADLEKMVDTSDEWIVTRSGIRERRIAAPDETVSTMGFEAAQKAIEAANINPQEIVLIQAQLAKFKVCWRLMMPLRLI